MRVSVELPDELFAALVPDGRDAARVLLEESVAAAYRAHRLTTEQVRNLLGFDTHMEVDRFLGEREIYDYTVDDFHQDLRTLARLSQSRRHAA